MSAEAPQAPSVGTGAAIQPPSVESLQATVVALTKARDEQDQIIRAMRVQQALAARPSRKKRASAGLARIGSAILAAFSTPEAVKAEKSLATLVVFRVLLMLGAGTATVEATRQLVSALGWS